MLLGIPTTLPFTRGRMTSVAAVILLTGAILLTQTIQAYNNESKYETVVDLITSLSRSSVPKEILDSIPCDAVNPTIVSYIDCKTLKDGAYQDPKTTNCSEYFRCDKQQRVNCSCGPELIFDAKLQECNVGSQKAPCPHLSDFGPCFNTKNGYYHVANTGCRKYFQCQDGRHHEFECNPGEAFDVERLACIDEGQTECVEDDAAQSDMPVQECSGKPDGRYGVADSLGKKFIVCSGGLKMSAGSCSEGQIFSEASQKCASPVPVEEEASDCKDSVDGYHPDYSSNCTHFFKCKAGQVLSTMTCPKNMKFDAELAYCLVASEVLCQQHSTDPSRPTEDECRGKTNGYHALPSTKCSQFVNCKNERKLMSLHCPMGQAFDVSFGRCMNWNFVHCEGYKPEVPEPLDPHDEDCYNKSDGHYPNYASNCKKFYICKDESKMSELLCHPGDAFDPLTKNCHPQATVDCHERGKPQNFCIGKRDGYYANKEKSCKTYYSCRGQHVVAELACGLGEIFKEDSQICWPQSMVACFPSLFDNSQKPVAPTVRICQNRTDGYYPDYASGCRKYFHCRTGHVAAEYVCTAGQLFDPIASKCAIEHCVSCSETGLRTDIDNCDFKNDGYYPMYCNGCKSYYYCRNRLNMVNITCAAGQIFDTNTKVCTDEQFAVCDVQASPNSSVECRGRSDGFYAASPSTGNCSIYFFCSHGMSSEKYSCSNGTCFDENAGVCVPKTARKFNCSAVPDGYYVDTTSSCRQYFVCQAGKLEVMKCPGNMIFHLNDISCKSKRTSQCKIQRQYNCSGRSDGPYEDERGDKHIFHVCQNGKHVESGSCPLYSNFNKQRRGCAPPVTRPPTANARPSWTFGNRPPSSSRHLFDCQDRKNGFYSDTGSGCSKYYVCVDGQAVKSSRCLPGQRFHDRKQECRPSEEVACIRNGTSPTSEPSSSFHFQFRDGCRNITLCFDSQESFRMHCPMPSRVRKSGGRFSHYCKIGNIAETQTGSGSTEAPRSSSSRFDCSGKEDGYYTDPDSDCRKWHMCEASRGYTYECEAGKAFNILHKRCDLSETIACAAQSWVYRNYSSARSLPSSFRSQTQEFRRQTSIVGSNRECGRKSDGIYIDLTGFSSLPVNVCFNVYLCINELLYSISCPFESKANVDGEREVMCKVKDDVKCMKDSSLFPAGPETREPSLNDGVGSEAATDDILPTDDNFTCADKDDGFYVDFRTNCDTFYACHGGATNSYTCPASLLFNSDTKACDLPENVVCSLQAVNALTCPENLTKLYPDHDNGCRSYFGCFNGSFLYLPCPSGTIFDAKALTCVAFNKVACTNTITVLEQDTVEAQPSSLIGRRLPLVTPSETSVTPFLETSTFNCGDKADGFYPDHQQECHVFYRCVHGKKFSHYCTSGQLFSSRLRSCDFAENVKCEEQKFVPTK